MIVRLNGEKVEGQEDFYRKIWKTDVGKEISIVVLRDEKFQVISVRTIDRHAVGGALANSHGQIGDLAAANRAADRGRVVRRDRFDGTSDPERRKR